MTIKEARNTGFIGRFTPVRIYDIRSDGYLQYHSYFMEDLTHEFDNYEIYHIDSEYDNETDRAYICIDIRRE